MISLTLVAIGAYLLGSVSFAVVVSRLLGLADPRTFGSGNPGATNMLRGGAKLGAVLTLLGDAGKGWLAVAMAGALAAGAGVGAGASPTAGFGAPGPASRTLFLAVASVAVFVGHAYPVFFRFRGGKGVATALGILLALNPLLGLGTLAVWVATMAVTRISSLAALAASIAAPLLAIPLLHDGLLEFTLLGLAIVLVARHRSNIAKLLRGEEKAFRKPGP